MAGSGLKAAEAERQLHAQCYLAASTVKAAHVLGSMSWSLLAGGTVGSSACGSGSGSGATPAPPCSVRGGAVAQALVICMWAAEGAWKAFAQLPAATQEKQAG